MADAQAILVKVAEAVAAELRSQTFTLQPMIERKYVSGRLLGDVNVLYVDVQAGEVETEAADRERIKWTCRIYLIIRKRFDTVEEDATTGEIDTKEIDRLVLLTEEIHDFFVLRPLAAYDEAVWLGVEWQPGYAPYSPEDLQEFRQFTGLMAIDFGVVK